MLVEINPEQLKELLVCPEQILLIDVREPDEYAAEHIDGAMLLPLGQLEISMIPVSDMPVILYCKSGRRSELAGYKLLMQDPDLEVYHLQGGIIAWKQAGLI